ncbi:protein-glucosylgalactosylhydroxylysine glucosidase isoform X2 [Danio rerio]|uniref:Protein-glucosylgalactosylhydroxylysine glucosidase isoform X2 n=2 Tax=Danio rerio TaxID=7955 RepID=A0AB32TEW0_DANRE
MTSDPVDPYIFTSDTLPSDPRFMPPLSNGLLGFRVFDSIMHMGGVYNGEGGTCHRGNIPCPLAAQMKTGDVGRQLYELNMHTGVFSHTVVTSDFEAIQVLYAHRNQSNLLVMEILLKRIKTSAEPITIQLESSFKPQSEDIAFQNAPDYKGGRHIFGQTASSEVPGGVRPVVHLIWTPVTPTLTLPANQSQSSWTFLVAVARSNESAQSFYDSGLALINTGDLRPSHQRSWAELWKGSSIEVIGAESLNRALIGCMFYLLGSFPYVNKEASAAFEFGGVSPGGLSNGSEDEDYHGHVFWDQDTWMYPSIALFYPALARAVLQYRVETLEGAQVNAQQMGCKGLKFAWESAVTGVDVCPEDVYSQQELHINGDVILAFQQYFYLTQDLELFRTGRGSEVVWGVADFWVSRVTWDSADQQYHIKGNKVKQADVVLLGFPLAFPMSPEIRRNDLEMYEAVTDPLGPAMTWGMFALGWLELGEAERAQKLLQKCFKNIQKPFQVWSESADGSGCVNFLTGMGGFLQAVLFGYTGFRVQKEQLAFSPLLPLDVSALSVKGVCYLGHKMDWTITSEEVKVSVRKTDSKETFTLQVVLNSGSTLLLTPGQSVSFPCQPGHIRQLKSSSSCWPI